MEVSTAGHRAPGRWRSTAGRVALIVLGGGIGTLLRWWLEESHGAAPGTWPWTTFAINLSGSLLLGALLEALAGSGDDSGWRRSVRLGVGTGLLGGYTTYSTFAVESVQLAAAGAVLQSVGYSLVSVGLGVACAIAGTRSVRLATGLLRRRR